MSVKIAIKSKKPKKAIKEKPPKASLAQGGKETVKPVPVEIAKEEETIKTATEEKSAKKEKYFQTVGRRKESIAIIRLFTKKSTDTIEGDNALVRVNDKDYRDYFSDKLLQSIVESPLRKLKSLNRFKATVLVRGGGLSGQADAIKHGLARALVEFDQNFRKKLKKGRFLTRDPRIKERRKYGLKKARKAPAWSKR